MMLSGNRASDVQTRVHAMSFLQLQNQCACHLSLNRAYNHRQCWTKLKASKVIVVQGCGFGDEMFCLQDLASRLMPPFQIPKGSRVLARVCLTCCQAHEAFLSPDSGSEQRRQPG